MSKYIKLYDAIMAMDEWFSEPITPTKILSDLPTIEVSEEMEILVGQMAKDCLDRMRAEGEWIWHEDEDICNCSECRFEIDATGCIEPMEYVGVFRYCPNCGAKMKGERCD